MSILLLRYIGEVDKSIRLSNSYLDVARVRYDLTFTPVSSFGNVNFAGICIGYKDLICKQAADDISGICFYI